MPATFDWDALAHDSPTSSEENQMSDAHTMPFAEYEGSDVRDTPSPPATLVLTSTLRLTAPRPAPAPPPPRPRPAPAPDPHPDPTLTPHPTFAPAVAR
jgi:hypothetical protein